MREQAADDTGATIQDLQDFPSQDHFERLGKVPELARSQQMLVRRGAPAEATLLIQERLHQQVAARLDPIEQLGHPVPVEVREDHHDVERAAGQWIARQVGLNPLDGDLGLPRCLLRRLQQLGISVDANDLGPACSGGDGVTALAARDIEDRGTGPDQARVPLEPRTGKTLTSRG